MVPVRIDGYAHVELSYRWRLVDAQEWQVGNYQGHVKSTASFMDLVDLIFEKLLIQTGVPVEQLAIGRIEFRGVM